MADRECGSCSMCCKLLDIDVLQKPKLTWCQHCKPGNGCQAYETRPEICRDFKCAWLHGAIPEEFKPDKVKAIVMPTSDGKGLALYLDEGQTLDAINPDLRQWAGHLAASNPGLEVILVDLKNEKRRMLKAGGFV